MPRSFLLKKASQLFCFSFPNPSINIVSSPASGFSENVLGTQTTNPESTILSPTSTPTSTEPGNILGTTKTASKSFDWRWIWLLLIIPIIWLVRSFSSKKN